MKGALPIRLGGAPGDELAAFRDRERSKLAEMGAMAGVPLGEAFKLIDEL